MSKANKKRLSISLKADYIAFALHNEVDVPDSERFCLSFRMQESGRLVNLDTFRYVISDRDYDLMLTKFFGENRTVKTGTEMTLEMTSRYEITKLYMPEGDIFVFRNVKYMYPLYDEFAMIRVMEEIEHRIRYIAEISTAMTAYEGHPSKARDGSLSDLNYSVRNYETIALHSRKIIELFFNMLWAAFTKRATMSYGTWQIQNIHKHLLSIQADYFPQVYLPGMNGGQSIPLVQPDHMFDTYNKLGHYLHAHVPFRAPNDLRKIAKLVDSTRLMLRPLLSHSRIRISNKSYVHTRRNENGNHEVWLEKSN